MEDNVCRFCGEEVVWYGDGFDCPFTDVCETCWEEYEE